jgi:hypothetical protein
VIVGSLLTTASAREFPVKSGRAFAAWIVASAARD